MGNIMVAGSIINKENGRIEAAENISCTIATNANIYAKNIKT
jgi:hypothetical protein